MKSFFWSASNNDGCAFYRMGLPAAGLRELGYDARASTVLDLEMAEGHNLPDVLIAQRIWKKEPSELFRKLAKTIPVLVELDDDLFNISPANKPAHAVYSRPEIQVSIIANLQAAAGVIVTNDTLAEVVSKYQKNVFIIGNFIPENLLDQTNDLTEPVVGWSGSDSHVIDFDSQGAGIRNFLRKFQGVEYRSMGADFRDKVGRPKSAFTGWTVDMNDYYRRLTWNVGVIPLRDNKFNQSKSPIKAMELHAKGVPVICSDTGPYSEYVQDGVDGILVSSPSEWFAALKTLVFDQSLREKMGAAGKAKASKLTVEANAHAYLEAFDQLI